MPGKLLSAPFFVIMLLCTTTAWAQPTWSEDQQQVLTAIARLSAATAPDGDGAEAYAAVLAEDFSRWTVGSEKMNDKKAWVAGVKEWFDDGWRVSDRQTQHVEVLVHGDFAFTRRIVEETYQGPDQESSVSKAALAEIWIRKDQQWLLFRVNVHPMDTR